MTRRRPPILRHIIYNQLLADGYQGLFNDIHRCACNVADLMPCDEPRPWCRAGYEVPFADGEDCGCGEGCDFHIVEARDGLQQLAAETHDKDDNVMTDIDTTRPVHAGQIWISGSNGCRHAVIGPDPLRAGWWLRNIDRPGARPFFVPGGHVARQYALDVDNEDL